MPNNYVLLETIALTQSAASVTFDNLPTSGYTDLKVVASTRTDYAGFLDLNMFFNGNASSGYSFRRLFGDGGSASSNNSTSAGVIPSPTLGTTSTANTFASTDIYIPNYRSSVAKSVSIDGVTENNATNSFATFTAGLSTLSTPITSISFGLGAGNFVANSTFSLYGVAALGTTPVLAPKATGGNIVANDGTYWYHAFLSSGSFVPQINLSCDTLVVAGGGGGGGQSGGGGAGGFRTATAISTVLNTNYAIVVGAGGTGTASNAIGAGGTGTNSTFATITSSGGGGGGNNNGLPGGSGGGGGVSNNTGGAGNAGSYSPIEGRAGGNGAAEAGNTFAGGGGGGAGAVGANASVSVGSGSAGAGGIGSFTTLTNTMSSVLGTGILSSSNYYYAGGGGGSGNSGGVYSTTTAGAGGTGGGGAGTNSNTVAGSGAINTGGGAGGAGYSGTAGAYGTGGTGGSGIVIIRYPIV